jgi:hypothetical protein
VAAVGQHFRASVAVATPNAALARLRPRTALQARHSTCLTAHCAIFYSFFLFLKSKAQQKVRLQIGNINKCGQLVFILEQQRCCSRSYAVV